MHAAPAAAVNGSMGWWVEVGPTWTQKDQQERGSRETKTKIGPNGRQKEPQPSLAQPIWVALALWELKLGPINQFVKKQADRGNMVEHSV